MSFTLGGEYIPKKEKQPPQKPLKIALEKRKNTVVTALYNAPLSEEKKKEFLQLCKKKLGCGGSIQEGVIILQGDKREAAKALLITNP